MVTIRNTTRSTVLADRGVVADTAASRMTGLLGRDGLLEGEGLVIDPCNSIHTFFMRFSIDVLFVDAQGVVVRKIDALKPWRLTWIYFRARKVIELPAGVIQKSGTQAGDQLSIERSGQVV